MNFSNPDKSGAAARPDRRGFTLTEIMVAMAIFTMVIGAVVYANIFGLRMYQLVQSKLSSTADARKTLNDLRDKIQSAKIIEVGTGSATNFVAASIGSNQQGNAIQIHPTTNLATYTRYFYNSATKSLSSITNGSTLLVQEAMSLTNRDFAYNFYAEDEFGNVMTNTRNNRVIRVVMEFYQLQYPIVSIGPGQLYDYYRLKTRVTRRVLE